MGFDKRTHIHQNRMQPYQPSYSEPATKQKYQAFVQEFERSRTNLFQNVKPQLGRNKSIDLLLNAGGSSPHYEGGARKFYPPHLNDSVRQLVRDPEYPPEKLRSPTGFSPNQSNQSCFPKSPMTLKDLNRSLCNSNHHINCKHTEVEPPSSKKKYQAASGGNQQNPSHTNSYTQLWQMERESHMGFANNPNENYILSVVNQENLPKNSYSHRFQYKKLMSNKDTHIMQQWYRDRKTPSPTRSTNTLQSRREWVGVRSFKNSKYYGRNDFYPQRYSPSRNSKQNSYYEYEEVETSKRRTPSPGAGVSSRPDSKENSFRSPVSNRKNAPGTPERNKEMKVNSQKMGVSPAANYLQSQKHNFSYPQASGQWVAGLRSDQMSNNIILGSVLKIQRAWRRALESRKYRALDAHHSGGAYNTGSFSAKNRESPQQRTPPKKTGKLTSPPGSNQTDQKISELQLLVEQLTFELRLANKNITFLKHENDKLKADMETIENNMQTKVDEKIAVEKLNNSELVNQYVNVVETLLEEKKELSQRTERLTSQMKEAEDIIRAQNEALIKNQKEIETKIKIQEENNRLRSHLDSIQTEIKTLKQELAQKPSEDEINLYKARSEEYEQKIQEMSKKMQEYEAALAKKGTKVSAIHLQVEDYFKFIKKKKTTSQEGSPEPSSARGTPRTRSKANTPPASLSDEGDKQKKESARSKASGGEESIKGSKVLSEKLSKAQGSPEKRTSVKEPSAVEKKLPSSGLSTPEKKSFDQSRKSSIASVDGKGSPPVKVSKEKDTPPKKGAVEGEKSSNKSTPTSNKARKTMKEKPSIDELPLQTKKRSDSVTASTMGTKTITKGSPGSQSQKAGGDSKATKEGKTKAKDPTKPKDPTKKKKKKSVDAVTDPEKQEENQVQELEQSPEAHDEGTPEMSFEKNKFEEKKHEVSFSQDPEFEPIETPGASHNVKEFYSFGSPESKGQALDPRRELHQIKRPEEGGVSEDTSLKEEEFDKMEEIHDDMMNRFGKFFSKVDEGLSLKHLEEDEEKYNDA